MQKSVKLELNPKPTRVPDSIILKSKTMHIIDRELGEPRQQVWISKLYAQRIEKTC